MHEEDSRAIEGQFAPALLLGLGELGLRTVEIIEFQIEALMPLLGQCLSFQKIPLSSSAEESDLNAILPSQGQLQQEIDRICSLDAIVKLREAGVEVGHPRVPLETILVLVGNLLEPSCEEGFVQVARTLVSIALDADAMSSLLLLPVVATDKPYLREEQDAALRRTLSTLATQFSEAKCIVRVIPVEDIDVGGRTIGQQALPWAIGLGLFLALTPSHKPLFRFTQALPSNAEERKPCTALGIGALTVPIEEVQYRLALQLSSELLTSIVSNGEDSSEAVIEQELSGKAVGASLGEKEVLGSLIIDLPLPFYPEQEGLQMLDIDDEQLLFDLAATRARRESWPEILRSFDAVIGRIKVQQWMNGMTQKAEEVVQRLITDLREDVDNIMLRHSKPLSTTRCLLTLLSRLVQDWKLPDLQFPAGSDEVTTANNLLERSVARLPKPVSLFARLGLLTVFILYALWGLCQGLGLQGILAFPVFALLLGALPFALGLFSYTQALGQVEQRKDEYINAIRGKYRSALFAHGQALLTKIQAQLLEVIETEERQIDQLEENLAEVQQQLHREAAEFHPPDCVFVRSIVQAEHLPSIYEAQRFDVPARADDLVCSGFLVEWRSLAQTDLRERVLDFVEPNVRHLRWLPFSDFIPESASDSLQHWVQGQLERLRDVSVCLLRCDTRNAQETVRIILPNDEAILSAVTASKLPQEELSTEDKYVLAVVRVLDNVIPEVARCES